MKTINGAMSRKQLADKYGISDKTLNRRLKLHKLNFGYVRVLLPKQIKEVIDALGPWETTYDET
jgi:hypothetical protein